MKDSLNLLPSLMIDFMKEEYRKFTQNDFDLELNKREDLQEDAYKICGKSIDYSTPSSALNALYHYISAHFNVNFSSFKPSYTKGRELIDNKVYKPLLSRRGNVLEVINDISYIKELIAWMAYNGANEIFFTFFLWDEVKDFIYDDLKKRDIKVTLGGHSLKYLMNKESIDPQSFSFLNNKMLISEICKIVEEHPLIQRVSLWPEDVGISDGNGDDFFRDYIEFTNTLQEHLLEVEVEHIIYNAGLSWEMLEPPKLDKFVSKTNALYAYWGRDYSKSILNGDHNQNRANNALKWWLHHQKASGNKLTVFEYYSDFFMLSEFYGPMSQIISEDVKAYLDLGVDSIVNLQVPIIKGRYFESIKDTYDYKHIHNYNNYVYIRSLWGENLDEINNLWYSQFKEDTSVLKELSNQLEKLLPQFSKYNFEYFPLRYVDMNDRHMDDILSEVIKVIDHALSLKSTDMTWDKDYKVLKEICKYYLQD